jgi:hypothetical protein
MYVLRVDSGGLFTALALLLCVNGSSCSTRVTALSSMCHYLPTTDAQTSQVDGVRQLSLGSRYRCALFMDRSVRCMGENRIGQLGNGDERSNANTIIIPSGDPVEEVRISEGSQTTCARTVHGEVWCWGGNLEGQVGSSHASDDHCLETMGRYYPCRTTPTRVENLPPSAGLVVSWTAVCSIGLDHSLWCWGRLGAVGNREIAPPMRVGSTEGTLSIQTYGDDLVYVHPQNRTVSRVAVHLPTDSSNGELFLRGYRACVLSTSGALRCSIAPDDNDHDLVFREDGPSCVTKVAIAGSHACAVISDGHVSCWGRNDFGQVGASLSERARIYEDEFVPALIPGISNAIDVEVSSHSSCAILANRSVVCWGMVDNEERHTATPVEW